MMRSEKSICVYLDYEGALQFMGRLICAPGNRREKFSFEFSDEWLDSPMSGYVFDPDLIPVPGRQYPSKQKFGFVSDSCPDRWGRLLMRRREALTAQKEGAKPRSLSEIDYLLGVCDISRMGALRFSEEPGGEFLAAETSLSVPPMESLRTLEHASLAFENRDDPDEEKWLKRLLYPGSSLGGARPKAVVKSPDGALWLAKFPARHDEWNTGAWEMAAHDLAEACGLNVPEARLETFSPFGSTFIVKRFDRKGAGRIPFASAMTMLGEEDGSDGASYLDIASFLEAHGGNAAADLKELFCRIVFSAAVSNTDDHLRNHGFLFSEGGWRLSPAYDINPNIYGGMLSLNIDEASPVIDFRTIAETAPFYGISHAEAASQIDRICGIVNDAWREAADKYSISRAEIKRMEGAFSFSGKGLFQKGVSGIHPLPEGGR